MPTVLSKIVGRGGLVSHRCLHTSKSIRKAPQLYVRESPVVHKKTWLEALHQREKMLAEHPELARKDGGVVLAHNDVKSREVSSRSARDSFVSVVLPFKDDKWFLDGYINAFGRLRMGQLFQDLDRLSGMIANKHCLPAEPVIVTASVDRILLLKRLEDLSSRNVGLWGHVTWTGRSSMEITIHACTTNESDLNFDQAHEETSFMVANFTFVARDPDTQRAFTVNHLQPETKTELLEYLLGEKYNQRKKAEVGKHALTNTLPTPEETKIVHDLWLDSRNDSQSDSVSMDETGVQTTRIMQPQYRNRHSYMIFGGYEMREAFETAYACAGAFSHKPPRFVSLDTVAFSTPVPVGSVLTLRAFVTYTEKHTFSLTENGESHEGTLVQVRVQSVVRGLRDDYRKDAGTFVFSFFVEGEPGLKLMPRSYDEMMMYIEGRRRAKESASYLKEIISH